MERRETTSSNTEKEVLERMRTPADIDVVAVAQEMRPPVRPVKRTAAKKGALTKVEKVIVSKLGEPENRHLCLFKSLIPTIEQF